MTRLMPEEFAVLEAAIRLAQVREASKFGPVGNAIEYAARDLDQTVGRLHGAVDGRYPEDPDEADALHQVAPE